MQSACGIFTLSRQGVSLQGSHVANVKRNAMLMKNCLARNAKAILFLAAFSFAICVRADSGPAINDRYAAVNGVKLYYLVAGKGDPVILLHGYAQNSHMWRPL